MAAIISRVLAALLGGYAFTWGFVSVGIAGLVFLGVDFHDAEAGILMLAFIVYLLVFLWAFAAASLVRIWSVLAGGALLMTAAGWQLQHYFLS